MERGRPKLENPRFKRIECRVSEIEFQKIEKICEKLKISKTEAILRGIDLLIAYKPKRYRVIKDAPKHSIGTSESEITFYNKKN